MEDLIPPSLTTLGELNPDAYFLPWIINVWQYLYVAMMYRKQVSALSVVVKSGDRLLSVLASQLWVGEGLIWIIRGDWYSLKMV